MNQRNQIKNLVFLALVCLAVLFASTAPAETVSGQNAENQALTGSLLLDQERWNKDLTNLRIEKTGCYTFGESSKKYGINDIIPNEQGLGDLYISGSEDFSPFQFEKLAETLRKEAGDREIWVIDLRRESHVMMGDVPVSWKVGHNEGNPGLTAEEIEADEKTRFTPFVGQTLQTGRRQKESAELGKVLTEREMVEAARFRYYRLPLQDHVWPQPEEIDEFIRFVNGLDTDKVWLHFHCKAGKGRTAIMMILYDKMRNPDIPITDIAVRQARLGGGYPLYPGNSQDGWKAPLHAEKARMTPLLGRYVEENHQSGYRTSWSDWIKMNE